MHETIIYQNTSGQVVRGSIHRSLDCETNSIPNTKSTMIEKAEIMRAFIFQNFLEFKVYIGIYKCTLDTLVFAAFISNSKSFSKSYSISESPTFEGKLISHSQLWKQCKKLEEKKHNTYLQKIWGAYITSNKYPLEEILVLIASNVHHEAPIFLPILLHRQVDNRAQYIIEALTSPVTVALWTWLNATSTIWNLLIWSLLMHRPLNPEATRQNAKSAKHLERERKRGKYMSIRNEEKEVRK